MKELRKIAVAVLSLACLCAPAQICTPDFCEFPPPGTNVLVRVSRADVAGISHGYRNAADFAAFLRAAAFGEGGTGTSSPEDSPPWSPFARLALVFLAGLALNLSPCVLPMIPVQLAVLGMGRRAASRREGLLRGCVYGAALALTYGTLGFAAVKTGAVFGRIQSLPAFNIAVGVVFAVLSLALFGLFPIDFSRFSRRASSSLSLAGLFLVGVTSALLAGACVAPAVIAAIVYAADSYAAGHSAALFLPLLLGCGMALPWPFVGAGLSVLPRPGKWMRYVEWGFAAVVLLLAVRHFKIAASAYVTYAEGHGVYEYTQFDAALAEAEATGKPVVIDFFASWCGSCETMEKNTFSNPEVADLLSRCAFLRIRVEDPGEPAAEALLARYGVRGFPAVVVLARR